MKQLIAYPDAFREWVHQLFDMRPTRVRLRLGVATDPTLAGGADGQQVVYWQDVAGALTYNAWVGHELVATDVTSPYVFTGLRAGTYMFGIEAVPDPTWDAPIRVGDRVAYRTDEDFFPGRASWVGVVIKAMEQSSTRTDELFKVRWDHGHRSTHLRHYLVPFAPQKEIGQ